MNGNLNVARPFAKGLLVVIGLVMLLPIGGCRLCCDSEDLAYPAYGGAWQRTRRDAGRVGSLFDPAGARTAKLTSRDEPKSVDELYRNRLMDQSSDDEPTEAEGDDPLDTGKLPRPDQDMDLKRRSEELKNLELEDIDLVPGDVQPPDFQ